jgi:hypothetical protein
MILILKLFMIIDLRHNLCGMCDAPYHIQSNTCVTYTGDPEGRMICRQCRNIRRKVVGVELVRQCPVCFGYAKEISKRMVIAGTTRHIRQRFRALEIAKCGLILEEAFTMLSKVEEVVMNAEMHSTHKQTLNSMHSTTAFCKNWTNPTAMPRWQKPQRPIRSLGQ